MNNFENKAPMDTYRFMLIKIQLVSTYFVGRTPWGVKVWTSPETNRKDRTEIYVFGLKTDKAL